MTSRALLAATLLAFIALPAVAQPDETPSAYVLCYHIVESPQDPRMEISRETFRQQMRYLTMTGYNVIPLRHLYEYVTGKRASIPKNSVVVTIDDGWRSTYTEVFPEMRRRQLPFTVFVYPKIIGQTAYALTWKQIREMSDAGVDIQSHSLSHPFLSQRRHSSLDDSAYANWLQNELVESKRILEKETGRHVDFLAYPYGDYDHRVIAASTRAGYTAALTCEFGAVRRGSDPLRMRRFVIDKKMDFAAFRHYLGARPMRIEDIAPLPNQVVEPEQPIVISAKIPNHGNLDPKSVGMALLTSNITPPFSYDSRDGSISMVIRDAVTSLKGQYQRAVVWATDAKTGRRFEATWTFHLPAIEAAPAVVAPLDAMPQLAAPSGSPSTVEPAFVIPGKADEPSSSRSGGAGAPTATLKARVQHVPR